MIILQHVAPHFGSIPGAALVRMPREIPWFSGLDFSIFWKGLLHLRDLTGYSFQANTGTVEAGRLLISAPTSSRRIVIAIRYGGQLVARVSTLLRILPTSGLAGTCRANINGDSITAAAGSGAYPNHVHTLIGATGITLTMHGSQTASGADAGVVQEGHPGWSYNTFLTDGSSPYASGGPAYVTAQGGGTPFTDVPILLGTNDMSGLGGSEVNWPTYAEDIADQAEALIAIVRAGSPSARVYVSMVYNFSDDVADWADADTLDAYYRRHRLVSDALYRRFTGRESEAIYLLATNALLDPVDDFDSNNVHPNATSGHPRIGRLVAAAIARHFV